MKIQSIKKSNQKLSFNKIYLDLSDMEHYGYGGKRVLDALMVENTPLQKALDHLSHPLSEAVIGDTYISARKIVQEGSFFDTILISWPGLDPKKTPFYQGFNTEAETSLDNDSIDTLCDYIKGSKIVQDLKNALKLYKQLLPDEKFGSLTFNDAFKNEENFVEFYKRKFNDWLNK